MKNITPAPWHLRGQGYIFVYRFPAAFITDQAVISANLQGKWRPSFGFVMLVNYESSNVGPYGELLFIPGKFDHRRGTRYSITKIYVSNEASMASGRANWGIPKEMAAFDFVEQDSHTTQVHVTTAGEIFFRATMQSRGLQFPFSTNLLKIPLVQELDGQSFHVSFRGKGKGRFVKVLDLQVNAAYFPDIAAIKPLVTLEIKDFAIEFLPAIKF